MPRLRIDNREVEVPAGATILDAARQLGIDIPALCFAEGCEASTSCLACLVKLGREERLLPACATAASEGLEVESQTDEVRQARRTALELLLSDHLGDCLAPCWYGCPARMDIPQMLRQVAEGDLAGAVATLKADIAMPAVVGRVCPAPCEKACRRHEIDGAVTIRQIERFLGDAALDLAGGTSLSAAKGVLSRPATPFVPQRRATQTAIGRRVAIVGGGPAGLAAAYYLAQLGHVPTIFEEDDQLGGRLLDEPADTLPPAVLAAEIEQIVRPGIGSGIELRLGRRVGRDVALAELNEQFAAVVIACGSGAAEHARAWGLACGPGGIQVAKRTFQTNHPATFAVGNAIRHRGMVIRSLADGKEAARAVDQFLAAGGLAGSAKREEESAPFSTRIGRMDGEELAALAAAAGDAPRLEVEGGLSPSDSARQAARCLRCDCRGLATCKLRKYAAMYDADPRRYKAERRRFQQDTSHADVVFEPGKCIDCGLCVQITATAGEPLGLTYIGRGFDVRVGVPLGHALRDALTHAAAQCVAACPTAALAWKTARMKDEGGRRKDEG
ncbi:MAG: 2Fe-2S iron-sulfur cluster-binding protein [Thermoguttaceae bacterium]|jgi:NADPH-dependent glutamate synthase beta subunit-like oxidoreductase